VTVDVFIFKKSSLKIQELRETLLKTQKRINFIMKVAGWRATLLHDSRLRNMKFDEMGLNRRDLSSGHIYGR